MRKGLLCRMGLHQWFVDGAWFTHADKCGRCGGWQDDAAGAAVDAERAIWASGPDGESMDEGIQRVAIALARTRTWAAS